MEFNKNWQDLIANLFIAPIQDILSLDDSSRLNMPELQKTTEMEVKSTLEEIEEI